MRFLRHRFFALFTALGLWCGMLLCLELGRRLGIVQMRGWGTDARTGVGAVDGAVFGLLALLVTFTFNGAANRFDKRRELVAEEANSLGTAWQRIDLLAADQQPELRDLFRGYLDALLETYAALPVRADPFAQPAAVARLQDAIWSRATSSCLTTRGEPARVLLLPSINEAFGAVERERMTRRIHAPTLIFVMLGLTELVASVFAGYALSATPVRSWVYIIGIATSIALATFVIIELEFPRLGLMRMDAMDGELAYLRETMCDKVSAPRLAAGGGS